MPPFPYYFPELFTGDIRDSPDEFIIVDAFPCFLNFISQEYEF